MTQVASPFQQFFDLDGGPLNNGYIYIGTAGANPVTSTITLYWDEEATLPAAQPLRTLNGYIVRAGTPARVYTNEDNYSILVRDAKQATIYSVLEAFPTLGKDGYIVNTIAELRALPLALATGDVVTVLGYYVAGDLGGGQFIYNSASAATEDNGAVIDPTVLAGRFLRITPDRLIPQFWGAKGDGSYDDRAAIQACVDYANTSRSYSNNGFTGSASIAYARFPAGVYRTSATVNVQAYTTLSGERASFKPDSGTPSFTFVASYQNRIDNLVFIGGTWAIVFETGNVDTSTITIENCEFQDQTLGHIQTSALSASTLFRVMHCKFYNNSSSATFIGIDLMGGSLHLTACWVTTAQTFIRNGDSLTGQGGTVICDDLFGVPRYAGNGGVTWVINSANLVLRDCRFGGESDGIIVVCNAPVTASQTYVIVDNCGLFPGDVPIVTFNYMPNQFQFTNNYGVSDSWEKGFLFNSGSTSTFGSMRGSTNTFIVSNNSDTSAPNYQGSTTGQNKTYCFNNEHISPSKTIFTADKVVQLSANGGAGWGGSNSGMTIGTSTNGFGASTRTATGSSATYNGEYNETYTTGLNGLSTGLYTVVLNVAVTADHIITVQVYAGENEKQYRLARGRHTLCLPTYFVSGTDQQRVGFGCSNMNNSQALSFGPVRIFAGVVAVDTENNIVHGTAAPTTLLWEKGDRVVQSVPTVGSPKGWFCTVAGTPGTWVSEGNL